MEVKPILNVASTIPLAEATAPKGHVWCVGRRWEQHTEFLLVIPAPSVIRTTRFISLAKPFRDIRVAAAYSRLWAGLSEGPPVLAFSREANALRGEASDYEPRWVSAKWPTLRSPASFVNQNQRIPLSQELSSRTYKRS